jgi:four helix bundle protein
MPLAFEDMRVLQSAEAIADECWKLVLGWQPFARDAMGKQLITAADSIGANIAEAFGRYHYGEKLTFLYYARGSLFETKYWLNRAVARDLVPDPVLRGSVAQLSDLARQLNALVASTKQQRSTSSAQAKAVREIAETYGPPDHWPEELFSASELTWLADLTPIANYQLPITLTKDPTA